MQIEATRNEIKRKANVKVYCESPGGKEEWR